MQLWMQRVVRREGGQPGHAIHGAAQGCKDLRMWPGLFEFALQRQGNVGVRQDFSYPADRGAVLRSPTGIAEAGTHREGQLIGSVGNNPGRDFILFREVDDGPGIGSHKGNSFGIGLDVDVRSLDVGEVAPKNVQDGSGPATAVMSPHGSVQAGPAYPVPASGVTHDVPPAIHPGVPGGSGSQGHDAGAGGERCSTSLAEAAEVTRDGVVRQTDRSDAQVFARLQHSIGVGVIRSQARKCCRDVHFLPRLVGEDRADDAFELGHERAVGEEGRKFPLQLGGRPGHQPGTDGGLTAVDGDNGGRRSHRSFFSSAGGSVHTRGHGCRFRGERDFEGVDAVQEQGVNVMECRTLGGTGLQCMAIDAG